MKITTGDRATWARTKVGRRENAIVWWMAATLARRNSHLVVADEFPNEGASDQLTVRHEDAPERAPFVTMNRAQGHLNVHGAGRWDPSLIQELLTDPEPFALIELIESHAEWRQGARATTPRSLTYRVIAQVLQSNVDDRAWWEARMVVPRDQWASGGRYCDPQVLIDLKHSELLLEAAGAGAARGTDIWVLQRDEHPVALLDTAGRIVVGHRPVIDMMASYRANGRRVAPVIAEALIALMP